MILPRARRLSHSQSIGSGSISAAKVQRTCRCSSAFGGVIFGLGKYRRAPILRRLGKLPKLLDRAAGGNPIKRILCVSRITLIVLAMPVSEEATAFRCFSPASSLSGTMMTLPPRKGCECASSQLSAPPLLHVAVYADD